MGKSNLLLVFLSFMGTSVFSQTLGPQELNGKVYSQDGDVAATHVLNITSQRAAITDIDGFFSITAQLNDTIVFSAVQYKKKELVVSLEMLKSKFLMVPLEEALTQLEEVIVMPYNLSGDMTRDAQRLEIDPVVTASTLNLPNAYVTPPNQTQRMLLTATDPRSLDFIFNAISGRTKKLKNQVKQEQTYARTEKVRTFYKDSLIVSDLKIPQDKIDDFLYYCEVDSGFQKAVATKDRLKIWDVMRIKSVAYRRNNELD